MEDRINHPLSSQIRKVSPASLLSIKPKFDREAGLVISESGLLRPLKHSQSQSNIKVRINMRRHDTFQQFRMEGLTTRPSQQSRLFNDPVVERAIDNFKVSKKSTSPTVADRLSIQKEDLLQVTPVQPTVAGQRDDPIKLELPVGKNRSRAAGKSSFDIVLPKLTLGEQGQNFYVRKLRKQADERPADMLDLTYSTIEQNEASQGDPKERNSIIQQLTKKHGHSMSIQNLKLDTSLFELRQSANNRDAVVYRLNQSSAKGNTADLQTVVGHDRSVPKLDVARGSLQKDLMRIRRMTRIESKDQLKTAGQPQLTERRVGSVRSTHFHPYHQGMFRLQPSRSTQALHQRQKSMASKATRILLIKSTTEQSPSSKGERAPFLPEIDTSRLLNELTTTIPSAYPTRDNPASSIDGKTYEELRQTRFEMPQVLMSATNLMPAMLYKKENFAAADGAIKDHEQEQQSRPPFALKTSKRTKNRSLIVEQRSLAAQPFNGEHAKLIPLKVEKASEKQICPRLQDRKPGAVITLPSVGKNQTPEGPVEEEPAEAHGIPVIIQVKTKLQDSSPKAEPSNAESPWPYLKTARSSVEADLNEDVQEVLDPAPSSHRLNLSKLSTKYRQNTELDTMGSRMQYSPMKGNKYAQEDLLDDSEQEASGRPDAGADADGEEKPSVYKLQPEKIETLPITPDNERGSQEQDGHQPCGVDDGHAQVEQQVRLASLEPSRMGTVAGNGQGHEVSTHQREAQDKQTVTTPKSIEKAKPIPKRIPLSKLQKYKRAESKKESGRTTLEKHGQPQAQKKTHKLGKSHISKQPPSVAQDSEDLGLKRDIEEIQRQRNRGQTKKVLSASQKKALFAKLIDDYGKSDEQLASRSKEDNKKKASKTKRDSIERWEQVEDGTPIGSGNKANPVTIDGAEFDRLHRQATQDVIRNDQAALKASYILPKRRKHQSTVQRVDLVQKKETMKLQRSMTINLSRDKGAKNNAASTPAFRKALNDKAQEESLNKITSCDESGASLIEEAAEREASPSVKDVPRDLQSKLVKTPEKVDRNGKRITNKRRTQKKRDKQKIVNIEVQNIDKPSMSHKSSSSGSSTYSLAEQMIILHKRKRKSIHSSMATSDYVDIESSEGSDTDSYDTLDPYYTKSKKKRRLNLVYPAIVINDPSQYQIHEQIRKQTDREAIRYTNMIYLKSKIESRKTDLKVIHPKVSATSRNRRNRMSLTYMRTDREGRRILFVPKSFSQDTRSTVQMAPSELKHFQARAASISLANIRKQSFGRTPIEKIIEENSQNHQVKQYK